MRKQFILSICSFSLALTGVAQPVVDITMAHNGADQIEVRLRPNGDFSQLISSVLFTVRWQEQQGPAVSPIAPLYPQSEYLPLTSSPIVNGGNGYLYRTFSAVPIGLLSDFGLSWQGGMEYPVCTLNVLVPGTQVELVNDAYTAANNRDFFVSMNGLPRTGIIYPSSGATVNAMAVNSGNGFMDVLLTPGSDYFGWINSVDFTLRWPAGSGSLGSIIQPNELQSVLPMTKVGGEVTENGLVYQRFHGEGAMSLAVGQTAFWANEDHLLMRLPINGTMGDAAVADDAWTTANDGTFNIVLNGHTSAGSTDDAFSTSLLEFGQVIPQMQVVGDELQVVTAAGGSGTLLLTVLNAAGQPVATRRAKWGTMERINMASWTNGIYTLRATLDAGVTARRFLR